VQVRSIMNGPVGQAVGDLLGTAGNVVTAIAGLPTWLLIGLGAAYLLGPAVLKMARSVSQSFSTAVKEGNAAAVEQRNKGAKPAEVKAYAEGLASEAIRTIRQQAVEAGGGTQAAQQRLEQATRVRAQVAARARSAGFEAADIKGRDKARELLRRK